MSAHIEIDGTTLVSIKVAASRVGYSRDYVSRLAREGKIVASQVGRQWFVDPVSLQNFAAEAELVESVRKQELSLERKRERQTKERVIILDDIVPTHVATIQRDSLLSTAAVFLVAIVSGSVLYSTVEFFNLAIPTDPALRANPVVSLSPDAINEPHTEVETTFATMLHTTILERPVFSAEQTTEELVAGAGVGLVLLPRAGSLKKAEEVQELFSDPVEVEFGSDGRGTITMLRSSGESAVFPFVTVPVRTEMGESDKTPEQAPN